MIFRIKKEKRFGGYVGCVIRRGTDGSAFKLLSYNPMEDKYSRSWDTSTNDYPSDSPFTVSTKDLLYYLNSGSWRIIDEDEEHECATTEHKF